MSHIPKHNSKKERKGHSGEDRRIDLLIPWDSVCVGDFLGHRGVDIGVEGSWRFSHCQFLDLWSRSDPTDFVP